MTGYEGVRSRPFDRPPGVDYRAPEDCPHEAFAVRADVNRLSDVDGGPIVAIDVELAVDCVACLTPMVFRGLPVGLSPHYPTTSYDGMTMTAPLVPKPATWDTPERDLGDFGLDRPGYTVTVWTPEDGDQPVGTHAGGRIPAPPAGADPTGGALIAGAAASSWAASSSPPCDPGPMCV